MHGAAACYEPFVFTSSLRSTCIASLGVGWVYIDYKFFSFRRVLNDSKQVGGKLAAIEFVVQKVELEDVTL